MHLLNLSFGIAVRARAKDDAELATQIRTKQLIGIAGVAAERIQRALKLPNDFDGLSTVLELHPLLNPAGYVVAEIEGGRLHVHRSPAHDDGSWISLCSPGSVAAVAGHRHRRRPAHRGRITGTADDWTAEFEKSDTAAKVSPEVEVTKFSLGATFEFEERRSLPLTVV